MTEGPLEGVHVVEFGSYVTGPYAASLLADLGADVVKIERPPNGDPFRGWGGDGMSPTFGSLNKGKRSVAVDLENETGRTIVAEIVNTADVFIENFRPGTLAQFGLGYDQVAARRPEIVYCSISGFGPDGPYAARPGYDTVGQALSGLLSLLTDMDDPKPMGLSIADHITGVFASYGILAALVKRGLTGAGSHVETSLLQATTAFLAENVARFLDEGTVPTRETRSRLAQAYAFVAGDGLPFVVHLSSPTKFWDGLVAAVDRVDLADDPRFGSRGDRIAHYEELHAELAACFRTQAREHWLERLNQHDVPAAPIYRLDEAFADAGLRHLDLVASTEGDGTRQMRLLRGAVNIGTHRRMSYPPAPLLGESTREILRVIGYDDAGVDALQERSVVHCAPHA